MQEYIERTKFLLFSVSQIGTVNLKINNWVRVGFCLPHKVHNINSEMVVKVLYCKMRTLKSDFKLIVSSN